MFRGSARLLPGKCCGARECSEAVAVTHRRDLLPQTLTVVACWRQDSVGLTLAFGGHLTPGPTGSASEKCWAGRGLMGVEQSEWQCRHASRCRQGRVGLSALGPPVPRSLALAAGAYP